MVENFDDENNFQEPKKRNLFDLLGEVWPRIIFYNERSKYAHPEAIYQHFNKIWLKEGIGLAYSYDNHLKGWEDEKGIHKGCRRCRILAKLGQPEQNGEGLENAYFELAFLTVYRHIRTEKVS